MSTEPFIHTRIYPQFSRIFRRLDWCIFLFAALSRLKVRHHHPLVLFLPPRFIFFCLISCTGGQPLHGYLYLTSCVFDLAAQPACICSTLVSFYVAHYSITPYPRAGYTCGTSVGGLVGAKFCPVPAIAWCEALEIIQGWQTICTTSKLDRRKFAIEKGPREHMIAYFLRVITRGRFLVNLASLCVSSKSFGSHSSYLFLDPVGICWRPL